MTLKVQTNPNPGPSFGQPLAPAGWLEIGKWAVNPADGTYFSSADLNPDGTVNLHEPVSNWASTPTGQTLTAAINQAPAPPVSIVPAPTASAAGLFVAGRTLAQAIAAGDIWGFTVDPSTR